MVCSGDVFVLLNRCRLLGLSSTSTSFVVFNIHNLYRHQKLVRETQEAWADQSQFLWFPCGISAALMSRNISEEALPKLHSNPLTHSYKYNLNNNCSMQNLVGASLYYNLFATSPNWQDVLLHCKNCDNTVEACMLFSTNHSNETMKHRYIKLRNTHVLWPFLIYDQNKKTQESN